MSVYLMTFQSEELFPTNSAVVKYLPLLINKHSIVETVGQYYLLLFLLPIFEEWFRMSRPL